MPAIHLKHVVHTITGYKIINFRAGSHKMRWKMTWIQILSKYRKNIFLLFKTFPISDFSTYTLSYFIRCMLYDDLDH